MFIGHFGVGLAAKKISPGTSLGTLVLSVQLVDLLFPIFLVLGLEQVRIDPGNTVVMPLDFYNYPITHSLVGATCWALILGIGYYRLKHYLRGALVLAAGVLSHWVLDLITHRPDLPILPRIGPYVGLGLWNSLAGTVIVELGLFALGVALYLQVTRAPGRTGQWALGSFCAFLLIVWIASIMGPPPPSETAIVVLGNLQWLVVLWAYWIDRNRTAKE